MVFISLLVLAVVVCFAVHAEITWRWAFDTEYGFINTAGDLIDGRAPAGRYTTDVSTIA